MKPEPPRLEELTYLYEKLSIEERDELLQCVLIAAPRGGEAMIKVLEQLLLCCAAEEVLDEYKGGGVDGGRHLRDPRRW